jgi:3-oxoacyl-[acyl-carrier-protein] synthase II
VIAPWTDDDIVITGDGCVTPLGVGMDALMRGWTAGTRAIAPVRRFSTERLPVHLGGEMPDPPRPWPAGLRGAAHLDAALDEALARSGLPTESHVLVLASTIKGFLESGAALADGGDAVDPGAPARRVGARFASCETTTVSTACTGGTAALVLAFFQSAALRRGEFDAIVVVGIDLLSDFIYSGFSSLAAVDPAPCRPFDMARAGMTPSEGTAVLVLENAARARARGAVVLGRLLGGGLSSDAGHPTSPDPDGVGLAHAIDAAMNSANASASDLGHIHAHGTGTVLNDASEVRALHVALGEDAARIPLTTLKGNLGHPFGAAGVLEVAASLRAAGSGSLPGIAGLERPMAGIDASAATRPLSNGVFLKTASGFGGFNAALLAEAVVR